MLPQEDPSYTPSQPGELSHLLNLLGSEAGDILPANQHVGVPGSTGNWEERTRGTRVTPTGGR